MRFISALLAGAAASGTVKITAKDCGSASDKGAFKGFTTQPDPIALGAAFQIIGDGELKETVKAGQYEVKVTGPLGIKLLDHKDTICGTTSFDLPLGMGHFEVDGLSCPHNSGDVKITQKGSLPSSVPVKSTKISLTVKDQDGAQLQCVNFELQIQSALGEPLEEPTMKDAFDALYLQHRAALEHEYTEEELEQWYYNYQRHVQEESDEKAALGVMSEHVLSTILTDEFLDARPAVSKDMAAKINALGGSWTAEDSARFHGWSVKMAKKSMGSAVGEAHMDLPRWQGELGDTPEAFDSRTQWAECAGIAHVRDQSTCGSCWAFGSTEAFNDRMCIASGGKYTTELSAQHTTSCCGFLQCFSQGCNGGQPGMAWKWLVNNGVVTGADYGDKDTCWPYEMQQCEHHTTGPYPACGASKPTPSCRSSCLNSGQEFKKVKVEGKSYSFGSTDEIKQSIKDKGPVTAAFTVYEDFLTYKSGVYTHKSGSALGGHAIKIVGWGKDETAGEYWIVANSWNESWGNKGFFNIAFGECGIDSQVSAGDVSAPSSAAQIVI